MIMGIIQKILHLPADNGVQGIVGTKEHDIVWLNIRMNELKTVVRVILIKNIIGIVLFIQKSQ